MGTAVAMAMAMGATEAAAALGGSADTVTALGNIREAEVEVEAEAEVEAEEEAAATATAIFAVEVDAGDSLAAFSTFFPSSLTVTLASCSFSPFPAARSFCLNATLLQHIIDILLPLPLVVSVRNAHPLMALLLSPEVEVLDEALDVEVMFEVSVSMVT
jgi:hypothetical protein